MTEKEVCVRITQTIKDEAERMELSVTDWFDDYLELASAIDNECLYQKVGETFLQLKMSDVKPYNESMSELKDKESYDAIRVRPELLNEINNKPKDLRTWVLQVINLGLMAPNMRLYILYDGEYCLIKNQRQQ